MCGVSTSTPRRDQHCPVPSRSANSHLSVCVFTSLVQLPVNGLKERAMMSMRETSVSWRLCFASEQCVLSSSSKCFDGMQAVDASDMTTLTRRAAIAMCRDETTLRGDGLPLGHTGHTHQLHRTHPQEATQRSQKTPFYTCQFHATPSHHRNIHRTRIHF